MLQCSSFQCTDFSTTEIMREMPSCTSLRCLGCGKRPAPASTCGKRGELPLVVRSRRRADGSQVQVPTGLEGSVFSISDSQMRVAFGSWTPELFLRSSLPSFLLNINLLLFVLSMTNLPRYCCGAGPGKQQTSEWSCFPGAELRSHPLPEKQEKAGLLQTCNPYGCP